MADVVCLVQSTPDRVSFTWSQGPDSFPPYHLAGQQLADFHERIAAARKRLAEVVAAYLDYLNRPQADGGAADLASACLALAQAGHELRKRLFKPSEGERDARDAARWLEKLQAQEAVGSIEVV